MYLVVQWEYKVFIPPVYTDTFLQYEKLMVDMDNICYADRHTGLPFFKKKK